MHNNLPSSNYAHMPMHTNEQHTESHECNKHGWIVYIFFFAPVHVLCNHTISIGVVTCTLAETQH